jgi:hypothetical protein
MTTYPTRLLFDRVRFFDINSIPFGVKGFTFADGLSNFGYAHVNPFGFSVLPNNLERGVGVSGV